MMNILNGGAHADNPIDFQEFMVMPVGAAELRRGAALRGRDFPRAEERAPRGGPVDRGRRRGRLRARTSPRPAKALDFILQAVESAGYKPGDDVLLALDRAATEYFKDGAYEMAGEGQTLTPEEMADYLADAAPPTIRSPRSRTAWPRTTWPAGSC